MTSIVAAQSKKVCYLYRRSTQLTQCGFHGPPSCPYKDVGEVVLDDRRLVQEGIGQTGSDKEDHNQVSNSIEVNAIRRNYSWILPFSMTSIKRAPCPLVEGCPSSSLPCV